MRITVSAVLIGAAALMAASASARRPPKSPSRPGRSKLRRDQSCRGQAEPATRPAGRPGSACRGLMCRRRRSIELDEAAVVADLPTVLDNETRDRYRRIFQAQAVRQLGAGRRRDPGSSRTRP